MSSSSSAARRDVRSTLVVFVSCTALGAMFAVLLAIGAAHGWPSVLNGAFAGLGGFAALAALPALILFGRAVGRFIDSLEGPSGHDA